MKKKLAMSLAAVMLLLSACGGPAFGEASSSPGQANTSGPSTVPAPSAGGNTIQFNPSATIEETVLVDESDVKITATGLSYTNRAVEVNLSIENNTDKNLSFQGGMRTYHCSSINGYMTDFLCFSNWVVPGNSAVLKVELDGPSLEKNSAAKLEDITEIELSVEARDNDYNTVADPVITFAGKPALN